MDFKWLCAPEIPTDTNINNTSKSANWIRNSRKFMFLLFSGTKWLRKSGELQPKKNTQWKFLLLLPCHRHTRSE